ncbi:MAG: hypothetical protein PVH10_05385, partial [Methyloceanibacter sp.]
MQHPFASSILALTFLFTSPFAWGADAVKAPDTTPTQTTGVEPADDGATIQDAQVLGPQVS